MSSLKMVLPGFCRAARADSHSVSRVRVLGTLNETGLLTRRTLAGRNICPVRRVYLLAESLDLYALQAKVDLWPNSTGPRLRNLGTSKQHTVP